MAKSRPTAETMPTDLGEAISLICEKMAMIESGMRELLQTVAENHKSSCDQDLIIIQGVERALGMSPGQLLYSPDNPSSTSSGAVSR